MSAHPRRLALAVLLGTGVLALNACGSGSTTHSSSAATTAASASSVGAPSAAAASVAVVGRTTSVTLAPATVQRLGASSINVTAVAPAKAVAGLRFPITGGHISPVTLAGTIEQGGGIKLAHGGRNVTLTKFVLDTAAKQITASVGGLRVPIFALDLSRVRRASGTGGTLLVRGVRLLVTQQAAASLSLLLGGAGLSAGEEFGVATLTVAVK
ncbi:MAG TPA: hypothetical protein VHT27_07070 [Solirubrobacteraceae bacterium]|jgi:hypothetical protein|nr:hypothetical protein [Solirubrobacteraceae bacterium]